MKRLLILIISAFAISLITPFEAIAEEGALEIKLHKKTLPTKFLQLRIGGDWGLLNINRLDEKVTLSKPLHVTLSYLF